MHFVTDASYVSDHKITIRFEDGSWRLVDLAPHLDGPVFEPLKDVSYFRRFTVNHEIDTLVWPNGADFDPATLHDWPQHAEAFQALAKRWELAAA